LYATPDHATPWIVARVTRPAAPGYAQPAVDFADDLADAKADALVRAILGVPPPAPIGQCSPMLDEDEPDDRPLLGLHGGKLELWWAQDSKAPNHVAIGPGATEADFWAWIGESMSDRFLARLERPAQQIHVRLVTEADTRMLDRPLLMIDDVDWLTSEEFDHLHRGGGLEALLQEKIACAPKVDEAAWKHVKLTLVRRALAADEANNDRRSAAFRSIELAAHAPEQALQLAAKVASEVTDEDDLSGIAFALASTLHKLQGHDGADALVAQWKRDERDFCRMIGSELAKLYELFADP
ncbi:MAG: hypothetical protein ACPG77_12495, partial [Nannocystaceae bacterium]